MPGTARPLLPTLPAALWLAGAAVLAASAADAALATPPTPATRPTPTGELRFHWRDDFSTAQRRALSGWVAETGAALAELVGPFAFEVHVFFHRRDAAREPVPWAHTQRHRIQGVHFYVDPAHPPEAFRRDWTAPHELSHLVLPYLGRRHAWFAEGFASFLQYRVMRAKGVLTEQALAARYRRSLARAERGWRHGERPFVASAPRLQEEGRYPTLYWGGAVYFLEVDRDLREHAGTSLRQVLREYLACCRVNRSDLDALVAELDRVSGTDLFSRRLERFRTVRGFPTHDPDELVDGPWG